MPPAASELAKKHLAVFDRKHEVHDHQVWDLHLALRERGLNVSRGNDRMPVLLEQYLKHVTKRWIVIENEDRLARGHTCIVTG